MKINVANIKNSIDDLNRIISNYENESLNINKLYADIDNYWNSEKSDLFSDKISVEQRQINNTISELQSFISIFDYIFSEYSKIGKNISFDFKNKDNVNKNLEDFINVTKSILILYNDIPSKYLYLFQNQIHYFSKLIDDVKYIKSQYNLLCDKINSIESNVRKQISKFNIQFIQESDVTNLM